MLGSFICVQQPVVPLRRRSRSCATYFARGGHACGRVPQRLGLGALGSTHTTSKDPSRLIITGRREVRITKSTLRFMWLSRERLKNVTRHMRQDTQTSMGLKDDVVGKASEKALVQDHRAHCLQQHAHMSFEWRRGSHVVSFRDLGCVNIRSHCV